VAEGKRIKRQNIVDTENQKFSNMNLT